MTLHKSFQADRDAPEKQAQPGETDIERTPLSLRNPGLAGPAAATGRPLRPGEATTPGGESTASDGHWLHDDVGPTAYVGPDPVPGLQIAPADLIARIEERLGYLQGFDASRVHVSIADGAVILAGQVESAEARRRAGACAVAAAEGAPVTNRLGVDR